MGYLLGVLLLSQSWLRVPMRKAPSVMACAGVLPSCCGRPPWCLISGVPDFCACRVAVSASILRSSSATRLSAFFCRLRVGGVVMLHIVNCTVIRQYYRPKVYAPRASSLCASLARYIRSVLVAADLQSSARVTCPRPFDVAGRFGRPGRRVHIVVFALLVILLILRRLRTRGRRLI